MKLVFPEILCAMETDSDRVQTVVIENQGLFTRLVTDIYNQLEGMNGGCILSQDNEIIAVSQRLELLSCFVPFSINSKTIVNRMMTAIEKTALNEDFYMETLELTSCAENLMSRIAMQCDGNISFPKLSIGSIIKASSPKFDEEYDSISEKILDYMELVRVYDKEKLFITVNYRSYIDDAEADMFMKSVLMHGYNVIMVENKEYGRCEHERRLIIDSDLCEIT